MQAAVSANHLLNAVSICDELLKTGVLYPSITPPANDNLAVAATLRECGALVGQPYYEAKAQLVIAEQTLLRAIKFQLQQCQPYGTLLHMCRALRLPLPLVQASVSVLNDVAAFSDVLLDTNALLLAAASIHLSSLLLECSWVLPSTASGTPWMEAVGVSCEQVERVGHLIMDALCMAREGARQAPAAGT